MLWLALIACPPPEPVDTDGPPVEDCVPEGDAPPLADAHTWASSEEGYGTGLGWADVNGDGWRDLVVASGNDMDQEPITVHFGRADGTLARDPDQTTAEPAYHGHLATGDVDGDGTDDVVVARYLGDDRFGDPGGADLYLGGPDGLSPVPDWRADGFHSFAVALGDADGDGDLDLAVAVGEPYESAPAPDRLYVNDGGFGDAPAWTSADAAHSLDVAFVDRDVDGDLDLVFARSGAPHAAYDNEGGYGAEPAWEAGVAGFDGNTLDWGDVDGDGTPDLLVSDNTITGPGVVRLFCGAAWEACWASPGGEAWSAVSLVDVDGDGDLDAVAGRWWGAVDVFANDGGLSSQATWTSGTGTVVEAFGWHDLDGSHEACGTTEGEGLVALPKGARVLGTDVPAAVMDGYVSAPGPVRVDWALSGAPDLAITNWDEGVGNWLWTRDDTP